MNIITLIPSKNTSTRVKNKNLKKLFGKPLINYTIEAAIKSNLDKKEIYISSESYKFEKIANNFKINFTKRPARLSTKKASTESVIIHFLTKIPFKNYDWILILPPTSPLRDYKEINKMIDFSKNSKTYYDSILSCYLNNGDFWKIKGNYIDRIQKKEPRNSETRKPLIEENSAMYLLRIKSFLKNKLITKGKIGYFPMSRIKSWDINTKSDFNLVELIIKNKQKL